MGLLLGNLGGVAKGLGSHSAGLLENCLSLMLYAHRVIAVPIHLYISSELRTVFFSFFDSQTLHNRKFPKRKIRS